MIKPKNSDLHKLMDERSQAELLDIVHEAVIHTVEHSRSGAIAGVVFSVKINEESGMARVSMQLKAKWPTGEDTAHEYKSQKELVQSVPLGAGAQTSLLDDD